MGQRRIEFRSPAESVRYKESVDISIPTIVGCIGAAMIIVAAVATPIAKSQRMREIWFYVMSSGVMLKVVVMELARIIQFI